MTEGEEPSRSPAIGEIRAGRRPMRLLLAAAAATMAAALFAPAARADTGHVYSFSITGSGDGALGNPRGVAVDNSAGPSAGAVYVTDPPNRRIERFDPSGDFVLMFGSGVNRTTGGDVCTAASGLACGPGEPGAFRDPSFVAVDSSAGPSAGDVYVADWGTDRVSKFDPAGHPIQSWGTDGRLAFSGISGIAVDDAGRLFVLDNTGPATMFSFDPAGSPLASFDVVGGTYPVGIAADSSGYLYKLSGGAEVEKYTTGGNRLGLLGGGFSARSMVTDPTDGDLYVLRPGGLISRFSGSCPLARCEPVETFGSGHLSTLWWSTKGVAVDSRRTAVYATNPDVPDRGVAVFLPPGTIPEATTGGSSQGNRSAILNGSVDPAGAGPVTGCRFDLVEEDSYFDSGFATARAVGCVAGYQLGSKVFAFVTGLREGTPYRYRLVAENANGRSTGVSRVFRTAHLPIVSTGPVSDLGPTAATLTARVDPAEGREITSCHFEYVAEAGFLANGYTAADTAPCVFAPPYFTAVDVIAPLFELPEATTFHYRVLAANVEGVRRAGADATFTTPPSEDLLSPPGFGPERRRVRCSKQACRRVLPRSAKRRTWTSPRFPRTYGWLVHVYREGHQLPVRARWKGCAGRFRGRGVIATVNGCRSRLRVTYRAAARFTIRWRVSAYCRCADKVAGKTRATAKRKGSSPRSPLRARASERLQR